VVISIVITVIGLISLKNLPVEQYPSLSPPMVFVSASYPGAAAQMIADEVGAPIEAVINTIDHINYMVSSSTATGTYNLSIYFDRDIDQNIARTNVQNQVSLMLSALPKSVQDGGVSVTMKSPSTLLFFAIQSKDGVYDDLFVGNYASIHVAEELERVPGVSQARVFNGNEYSMRIWLKTDQMAQLGLTYLDVISSIKSQTTTGGAGELGQAPSPPNQQLTLPVLVEGTIFSEPAQFENIIVRATPEGAVVQLKDVANVELGSRSYSMIGHLNGKTGAFIAINKSPDANAVKVAKDVRKKMEEISQFFPKGITYSVPFDTSTFIRHSIAEVEFTFFEATVLVSLIIFLFLHSLRATLIPVIAMIVSIAGTFFGMHLLGFSINLLTLFALVLSIGIVVDDAIIVVENVARNIKKGLEPKEAAIKSMQEVAGPIIAIVLVLSSVFIPSAFIGGIQGQFYKQFALVISFSVFISGIVALTLSPVAAAYLFRHGTKETRWGAWFDRVFDRFTEKYLNGTKKLFSFPKVAFSVFALVLIASIYMAKTMPRELIPREDQGYVIIAAQLPDGATINRTEAVSEKIEEIVQNTPGVQSILSFSGYALLDGLMEERGGAYFVQLKDWNERKTKELSQKAIINKLNEQFNQILEAQIVTFAPAAISGMGGVGGYELWVANEGDIPPDEFNGLIQQLVQKASQNPLFKKVVPSIEANCMALSMTLDRIKAIALGVDIDDIFETLRCLLSSVFVTHFHKFGRVFDAVAQADPADRAKISDIGSVCVRSKTTSEMVPLGSLLIPKFSSAPLTISRFNDSFATRVMVLPNSGDALKVMETIERTGAEIVPNGVSFSWGGLAREERKSGGASPLPLFGGLLLVFLVLAALYERWSLPIVILLTVPFATLGAFIAIWIREISNDIFFQIGILTLVALSAKNAILIVEFAKMKKREGMSAEMAALEGAALRFRAILMTSFTLIFGVIPLVFSTGAGALSRHSVGTGILGGMIFSTFLGVFFVPLFYKTMEEWLEKRKK
jgi:hydrophobe/amphiphile efflux-1 (HAE1) family protein